MSATEEPKKKRVYTCVNCKRGSCRENFLDANCRCEKCSELYDKFCWAMKDADDSEVIKKPRKLSDCDHAEICWRKAMGNYTDRCCSDVYRNVFVNNNERELRPDEKQLLYEIYLRSGGRSRNPFIFRLLPQFQP